ncbi:MAG: ABC transporter permease [Eubacteriales bacterium]
MISIAFRNLKVFFRDKSSVFFSLLSVLIIIALYVLFLGDTLLQNMNDVPSARFLMDSWIMSGLLAVTSITATMGAFGIMVEDQAKKNINDFYAAPLKRRDIAAGYILSSFLIGIIISFITFVLSEIYIVSYGGEILPFWSIIKVFGLIFLSVISSSSMVFFMVSFFKSNNAFSVASTILGTLIGFLTGIYIPIGILPGAIQFIIKIFPVSHAGVLFRQILMDVPLSTSFGNAPIETVSSFKEEMGIVFKFGDTQVSTLTHILVLIATAIVFYGLAVFNISRKSKLK